MPAGLHPADSLNQISPDLGIPNDSFRWAYALITATALAASVSDPEAFRSGRHFAAFLGLVPRQNSSGGKERLGHITKMGNGYLRRLLVIGATSVVRRAGASTTRTGEWLRGLLERKPARLVTVAMANKTARIAWAVMAHGRAYRAA